MHRDQKTGSIVGHFVYFLKPVVPEISHILPRSGGLAKSLSHCMASETLSHQASCFLSVALKYVSYYKHT